MRRTAKRNAFLRLARWWRGRGGNTRLGVGILAVLILWWISLDTVVLFGVEVPWPIGLLVAAMGWARVGLSMRPMASLVALSVLFDLGVNAPIGSYLIVALVTYGVHAAAGSALDLEHDPFLNGILPFVSLVAGLFVLWILASASAGHATRLAPIVSAGLATAVAYSVLAPLFHLRVRPGGMLGRA